MPVAKSKTMQQKSRQEPRRRQRRSRGAKAGAKGKDSCNTQPKPERAQGQSGKCSKDAPAAETMTEKVEKKKKGNSKSPSFVRFKISAQDAGAAAAAAKRALDEAGSRAKGGRRGKGNEV